jgi:soluble lytic murein transglycosylase-like protein
MLSNNRALRACLAAAALFVALLALPTLPKANADFGPQAACSGRLCFKNEPGTKSCWRKDRRAGVSKCFIKRAAAHFRQSKQQAYAIAYRESRFNYRVTNSSSGAAGLYQFMPQTWQSTPYHKKSPYSPKYASLAAMWMWSNGGYSHWSL